MTRPSKSKTCAAETAPLKLVLLCCVAALAGIFIYAKQAYGFENGSRVEIEAGAVWQSRNSAQSPTRATTTQAVGTRFSLKQLQGAGPEAYGRVSASYTWDDKHQVHALYAPLTFTGTGRFASPVIFQGTTFLANTPTTSRYRFDSYRVGYRYKFLDDGQWQGWGGFTLKVRDANIALSQGNRMANRANTGPVPLLSLYLRRNINERWSAILDAEGLAAPQGRALDAALKLRYQLNNGIGLNAGYRTLEGGADNKKVYTFAWVHYGLVSLDYKF